MAIFSASRPAMLSYSGASPGRLRTSAALARRPAESGRCGGSAGGSPGCARLVSPQTARASTLANDFHRIGDSPARKAAVVYVSNVPSNGTLGTYTLGGP